MTPWRGLVAVAAICASATSARADLTLAVTDNTPGGVGTQNFSITTTNQTFTFGSGANAIQITAHYATASTASGSSLMLDATVVAGANGSNLNFSMSSGTSGAFSGPSGVGYLKSSVQALSYSGTDPFKVTSIGQYVYGGGAGSVTDLGGVSTTSVGAGLKTSNGVAVGTIASQFDLKDQAVNIQFGQGTLHFTAAAAVALPEPSGVIAAFAGLPCMGLLLGFARRSRTPAVVAAV